MGITFKNTKQLDQIIEERQQIVISEEERLKSIDMTSMRIDWLFQVIEHKESFKEEYINRCVTEIKELLITRNCKRT